VSIFVEGLDEIRASQPLDNQMPDGYSSLEQLDVRCLELVDEGRLFIVDNPLVRKAMASMKLQQMSRSEFRELANIIFADLIEQAVIVGDLEAIQHADGSWDKHNCKVGISIRAGLSFMQSIEQHPMLRDVEIGFLTQTRDEEDPDNINSAPEKLGRYDDVIALLADPMLAKGGSMLDFINRVKNLGAKSIITVTAFSAPQGIVRIADNSDSIVISTPLEAGLNERAYIVGGVKDTAMLGDAGDRRFGKLD